MVTKKRALALNMAETEIRTYSHNRELITERREHIARCVAPLFVKKGYEKTTIRDIAAACGMSMGHLYYYIGSKEDVLQIMLDYDQHFYNDSMRQIINSYETLPPTEALIKSMDHFFRGVAGIPDFMRFFYQQIQNLQPEGRKVIMGRERQLIGEFEKLLQRGCDTGDFKIINISVTANNIVYAGHMWSLRRNLLTRNLSLDEYIRCQTEIILKSMSARIPISIKGPDQTGN